MALVQVYPKHVRAALALAVLTGTFTLGACSDRDAKLAEAVSKAERAAKRAEDAALRVENAAKRTGGSQQPMVIEDEPEQDPHATETEQAQQDSPPPAETPERN